MTSGMMVMVLALLVAGLVQVYISRVLGEGFTAQVYMAPWAVPYRPFTVSPCNVLGE